MRRFRFRLEALARLRRLEEDRRLSQFRQKRKALLDVGEELERIATEREHHTECLRDLEQGSMDLEKVLAHRRYLIHLHNQGVEKSRELEQRNQDANVAKTYLDEAMRERKVVERLRERRYKEYLDAFRREETREMDEVGSNRQRFVLGEAGDR